MPVRREWVGDEVLLTLWLPAMRLHATTPSESLGRLTWLAAQDQKRGLKASSTSCDREYAPAGPQNHWAVTVEQCFERRFVAPADEALQQLTIGLPAVLRQADQPANVSAAKDLRAPMIFDLVIKTPLLNICIIER